MNKVLIITGLTASGKSSLALEIAKKYNGEIISCDSVQVYRGLDIGSAKESKENMQLIPHHLIDIVEPNVNYNVSMFLFDVEKAIKDCLSRNKLPILVGGTMMYIKALIEGYTLGKIADNEFRNHWQEFAIANGKQAVWEELNKLNSNLASKVHYNNLNRVIRYLELATFGEPTKQDSILKDYNVLAVGINIDKSIIYPIIDKRVDIMLEQGLENEVRALIYQGLTLDNNSLNTIGYREMYEYITGKIDYDTAVNLIKQHTRNYAKRQLTFMKTINNLNIVDKNEAKLLIEAFLKGN